MERELRPLPRPAARRVLVAEDEPNIVLSLEFLLREAGHEVAVASDGAEALRMIEAAPPDLVILDVMLPSVNGFDLCRRLREDATTRSVRVLMLTARGRDSEVERGMAAGADAYMTKPFATRDLIRVVGNLLDAAERGVQ